MIGIAAVFAKDGALARALPAYRERAQQVELAERIAAAIRTRSVLIAEAGTGTGKTVAYLVPALLYGGKVIISTGTKTLQDQLFHRDLPLVRDALEVPVSATLLKGRANYLCLYHLDRNSRDGRLPDREAVSHLQTIVRFARRTQSGDKSELPEVPEDAAAWRLATSTRDNCLGQSCPDFKDCYVMRARRAALEADLVVVNHHLFFADAMLRDEGMAELLPAADTVILDEAHQIPDTATLFFGDSVSTAQVLDLCRDANAESLTSARDVAELQPIIRAAEKAARDLRLAIPVQEMRVAAAGLAKYAAFPNAIVGLTDAMLRLSKALETLAERSEGLAACARRAGELRVRLERWRDPSDASLVRWVEAYNQSLALQATPLSIAPIFRRQIEARPKAWILASATLSIAGDFAHFQDRMGLADAATVSWESPFDYSAHALLYVPTGLPDPNAPDYTERVVAAAIPALRASRGRAFLLFTTLRGMRLAHERLVQADLGFPLLLQGQGSRSDLLDRFRQLGNAVLVGSHSFWEGVDVRGEALSLVIIDKLPFAPPDDPVLAARLDDLARSGRNAFIDYQVPQAAIQLKQGAGRLIRDEEDRGVLMICDPRLVSRSYGKRILAALPPMRRTRDPHEVARFFDRSETP